MSDATVRIPRVWFELPMEGEPRLIVEVASAAERTALIAWVLEVHPRIYEALAAVSRNLGERRRAA